MRELNRLGVTSAIDAGGGFQNYPDDYQVIEAPAPPGRDDRPHRLQPVHAEARRRSSTDFRRWVGMTRPGAGRATSTGMNGAGEMLVFSAADFEDFLEPRPDLAAVAGGRARAGRPAARREPLAVPPARHLRRVDRPRSSTSSRRSTATCRSTGLHWFFDHAETITDAEPRADQGAGRRHRRPAPHGLPGRVLRRPLRRRGGRARRRRSRRCWRWASRSAAGTDATRVASYNPWVCAATGWSAGRTVGGLALYPRGQPARSRDARLRL